jgi:hypothetical protein
MKIPMIAELTLCLPLTMVAMSASADINQDCILEGTVDKKRAEQLGQNVYVAFHSASATTAGTICHLPPGRKLAFKEPKNAMIENVPDGSEVTYHYIQRGKQQPQWRLISVNMK